MMNDSSGYDVQAGVDVNRVACHPGSAATDEEGHCAANFCDINQAVCGSTSDGRRHEFVEFRDAARRSRLQWPR